jgi:hypothetical protein
MGLIRIEKPIRKVCGVGQVTISIGAQGRLLSVVSTSFSALKFSGPHERYTERAREFIPCLKGLESEKSFVEASLCVLDRA